MWNKIAFNELPTRVAAAWMRIGYWPHISHDEAEMFVNDDGATVYRPIWID